MCVGVVIMCMFADYISVIVICYVRLGVCLFQAEDGIRDLVRSRGLGDVYKRQGSTLHRRSAERDRAGSPNPETPSTAHSG